ncbi:MAG: AAA family ATPase [Streptosporangiales bacterium]|nr:AAA family ATPase [Streptosporangiales bacterium]
MGDTELVSHGPRVVLVGPPGAGKTSVGELLAERLGVEFRDTDGDVEERTGTAVSEIFVSDGEAVFRQLEREAVETALATHTGVLALGGGAVLDEHTRALLREHTVVFLDVTLAAAAQRVGLDAPRPLLVVNPRTALRHLMAERRPLYEEVATATVATADRTPSEVAAEVSSAIGLPV